jgi:hypothetical protein
MGWDKGAFEVQANGNNTNSGFFDVYAAFTNTLSTSNGTSATPTVTASNYTFLSSDVGNYLFIATGTSWYHGWYRIASVTAGAATVDAAIGKVARHSVQISPNQGVASTNSASSGSWSIDYSQTNTAKTTYSDLAIVTAASYIQSAANPFTVNLIGNSIKISGGVNFTTGTYIITNISVVTALLDRNIGTVGATGGSGKLGGAVLDFNTVIATVPNGAHYHVFFKASSGIFTYNGVPAWLTNMAPTVIGYSTVRGDHGKAELRLAANSTGFTGPGFINVSNMIIDGQNNTGTLGIGHNYPFVTNHIYNCDLKNLATGINFGGGCDVYNCTFSNCTTASANQCSCLIDNVVINCGGTFTNTQICKNNLFVNHTSGNVLYAGGVTQKISNNTFYNITGNCITPFFNCNGTNTHQCFVENNIFSNVSGYVIRMATCGSTRMNYFLNNAYFSITSGFIDTNGSIIDNGSQPPFISKNNIALSASPFISAANLDLRLNNDTGGGRSCKGAGQLQAIPLTATVSALDIGAVQSNSLPIDRNIAPVSKSLTIKSGTTSYTEFINLIGIGYTTSNLKAYYTRVGSAPVEITLTSQTVNGAWTSGGFVEIDTNSMPGIYRFDIPNAVFASGSSSAILQISNISTGDKAIIIYKFQDPQNIDLTQTFSVSNVAQTVGDALNAARSSSFGKWVLNDRTLSLYGADNTTIVKTFTLNSSTFPTERS